MERVGADLAEEVRQKGCPAENCIEPILMEARRSKACWKKQRAIIHVMKPDHIGDTIYEPFSGERYDIILTNPPSEPKGQTKRRTMKISPLRPAKSSSTLFSMS